MARETRGGTSKDSTGLSLDTTGAKRKRQTSASPAPPLPSAPSTTSIKLVVPSPSTTSNIATSPIPSGSTKIHISPSKLANGVHSTPEDSNVGDDGVAGGVKRQKINLKISKSSLHGNGSEKTNGTSGRRASRSKSKSPMPPSTDIPEVPKLSIQDEGMDIDPNEDVGAGEEKGIVKDEKEMTDGVKKEGGDQVLEEHVREGLRVVVQKMASKLPPPFQNILDVRISGIENAKKEETLGQILKQRSLTWERLVDSIHALSGQLVSSIRYPNPFSRVSRIHIPPTPLPSHLPPHPIYTFCVSLRSLILDLEPFGSLIPPVRGTAERWALMQKGQGSTGQPVEWWTSVINSEQVEQVVKEIKKEGKEVPSEGVFESMAAKGDMFGHASAVAIHSTVAGTHGAKSQTLADSIVRRASLKAQKWKETLQRRKQGGFGSIKKPVSTIIPKPESDWSFTPTYGIYYDSTNASGGSGYWDTLEGMHERNRTREWRERVFGLNEIEEGWRGSISDLAGGGGGEGVKVNEKGKEEKGIEDILRDNFAYLDELQAWQDERLKRGDDKWLPSREQQVAEELMSSLTALASHSTPSTFLPEDANAEPGLAHRLASRFIPTSAPSIRGTLDPRRPKALRDNNTVRYRVQTTSTVPPLPSTPSNPHAPSNQPKQFIPGISSSSSSSAGIGPNGQNNASRPSYNPQGYGSRPGGQGVPAMGNRPPVGSAGSGYPYVQTPPNPFQSSSRTGGSSTSIGNQSQIPGGYYTPRTGTSNNVNTGNTIYNNRTSQANLGSGSPAPQGYNTPIGGAGAGVAMGLPSQPPLNAYARPGPGPSALRQSFGPGTPGATGTAGAVVGGVGAVGGYNAAAIAGLGLGQYRPPQQLGPGGVQTPTRQ